MSPSHNTGPVVACAAYAKGRRVDEVALRDVSEVVKQDDRFVWIGLYEPDEQLFREVQAEFGLHDLAIEDANQAHQRPKLEQYGDSLFIAPRTAQPDGEHLAHRLRRDAHLHRVAVRRLCPPRRVALVR
jgi:magnesium transporter